MNYQTDKQFYLDLQPQERTILVFQYHYLLPSITCEENIYLPARIRGKKSRVLKEKIPHVVCGYRLWKWVHPSSNRIFGNLQIFRWKSLPKQTNFPELRRS